MARAIGIVLALLMGCVALPVIARVAQHLIPYLVALLMMLAVANLWWPSRRRRR